MQSGKFTNFARVVVVFNLAVILWGAFVRATGSGAGCGSHWPLCNGQVLPRAPQVETLIELAHRLTSGVAFLLVLAMLVWALRLFPKGHPARLGAVLSTVFIITEALVGAGLVLFEWTGVDQSVGRVISMGVHLINTFLLLAALVMTVHWGGGGEPVHFRGHGAGRWLFGLAFLLMLLLGVSGAVTALGDTLFPAGSLAEGIAQDFEATAHFLVRLRVWHPLIAVLVGLYVTFLAGLLVLFRANPAIRRLCGLLFGLFVAQLLAGVVNLLLLAPVWMQLVHLLLADLVWITLVQLALYNFAVSEVAQVPAPGAEPPVVAAS